MKKRIISLLLTVLMVMSLFAGMGSSAYALTANDTIEHTMQQGDTVLKLCQALGIDYYVCRNAIMKLNGITSENQFRYLSVGRVIKLPTNNNAALEIMGLKPATSTTPTTPTATAAPTASTTAAATVASDKVVCYYIPYVMQKGDTFTSVCNAFGIDFKTNEKWIKTINNLTSLDKVKAGQEVLIPTYYAPAAGTTCYQVAEHAIKSGETAISICGTYGVSYGKNTKLLQAMNGNTNLSKLKAGQYFYLPVLTTISTTGSTSGTVTPPSASKPTTTTTSTTTVDKDGNTTTTTTTTTTNASTAKKTYKLTANINTAYGTMTFLVDNKSVDNAAPGAVVTVVVDTVDKKALNSLTVKYADGSADLKLDTATFIMPACDVRVDAVISNGYDIAIQTNNNYYVATTVEGLAVSSAAQGTSVRVVSTDSAYEIADVKVTYSTWLGLKKEVTVNSDNFFQMPAKNVTVSATVKPVTTYNFYRTDSVNGNFDLQVNGFSASKAAKGAKVTIVWKPMAGFELTDMLVCKGDDDTGDKISVYNNSFTMPASDVYVELTFGKKDNAIIIEAIEGGELVAKVGGTEVKEAKTGEDVELEVKSSDDGYSTSEFEVTIIRNSDGNLVKLDSGKFKMPAGGVTIKGKLLGEKKVITYKFYDIDGTELTAETGNLAYTIVNGAVDGKDKTIKKSDNTRADVRVGSKVGVKVETRDTWTYVKAEIAGNHELTNDINSMGYFLMPDDAVTINLYFSTSMINIGKATISGASKATISYKVLPDGTDAADLADAANWTSSAAACSAGDYVAIIPASVEEGYKLFKSGVTVTDKKTGASLLLGEAGHYDGSDFIVDFYYFQMPADGVNISTKFTGVKNALTLHTVLVNPDGSFSEVLGDNATVQGKSLWEVAFENDKLNPVVENEATLTVIDNVSYKAGLFLYLTDTGAAQYSIKNVKIETATKHYGLNGEEGGLTYTAGRYYFYMPESDTDVYVYLMAKGQNAFTMSTSYDSTKGSVQTRVSHNGGGYEVTNMAYVGDYVEIIPKPVDPYTVRGDKDITITRKSDGGVFTIDDYTSDGDMVNGKVYWDATNGVWKFIMPEGGVSMKVTFVSNENILKFVFFNAADGQVIAPALNAEEVISVTIGSNTRLFDAADAINKVTYKSAVSVAVANAQKTNYSIAKIVAVTGYVDTDPSSGNSIPVSGTSFKMPAENATVKVYLNILEPATKKIALTYSANDKSLCNVTFYKADGSGALSTEVITEAEVDEFVYFKVSAKDGYIVDKLTAVGAEHVDNTGALVSDDDPTVEYWKFKMAAQGMSIKLNVVKSTDYVVKMSLSDSTWDTYVMVATNSNGSYSIMADGETKAATYTKTVTIKRSINAENDNMKIDTVKVDGTEIKVSGGVASFKMPAADVTVEVTLVPVT